MNKPLFALFVLLLFFYSCSSDNDTPPDTTDDTTQGTDDTTDTTDDTTDDSSQTMEEFLFGVDVVGDYFSDARLGEIFVSDQEGNIIAEATLTNNGITELNAEFDFNTPYDFSFRLRVEGEFGNVEFLRTFRDVSPQVVTLTNNPNLNPDFEQVELNLFNAGFPLEVIAPGSVTINGSTADGGSAEVTSTLKSAPGDFFGLFLSPDDTEPRYVFLEDVSGGSEFTIDYTSLAFAENQATLTYPSYDQLALRARGYKNYDGNLVRHDLFTENFDGTPTNIDIYSPSGIFENFQVTSQISTSGQTYFINNYGPIESQTIELPDLDFNVSSNSLSNYAMTTASSYNYHSVFFTDFISDTDTSVQYFVFSDSNTDINFSLDNLFDQIYADESGISATNMVTSYSQLHNNSAEPTFDLTIQSRVELTEAYPAGTKRESLRKN